MMDEDGLSNRNWGYYEPSQFRPNLGFQLIPSSIEKNEKPFVVSPQNQNQNFITPSVLYRGGGSSSSLMSFPRDYTASDAPFMSYSWLNQHRDSKFFSNVPNNPSNHTLLVPETSRMTQPMQLLQPEVKDESLKRKHQRGAPKANKEKKLKDNNMLRVQRERSPLFRKSIEMVINGVSMDIGCLPVPVCSCTGMPQQCYRWGCGGWQSACCTTNVSMYPLPISAKRRGARIAGRKMSQGAFRKVLEKLSADGFDFSIPIDLKSHWAKHGTNKFVTIR
ncbi:PREDICTED: protein BASIC PENTACYSTEINE3-like [Camelina sativa]|uniref:GAGA-binding transcriptional activator n=1 Tax=Camelina sativa TaxID=90675 RepID=A0ABM0SS90_CAMSA|nr:PREDICTED: protein BASIC PENTACYSTEINE3-like [Camelina sativa]